MLLTNFPSVEWWHWGSKEIITGLPLNIIGTSWKVISGGMFRVSENFSLLSCDTWHALTEVPSHS